MKLVLGVIFLPPPPLGSDFGELLAIQFTEMWHKLDCPNPFYLVEMGAGNGELTQDVLLYLRRHGEAALLKALNYIIIERSPYLIERQRSLLQSCQDFKLTWQDWGDIANEEYSRMFFF